MSLNNFKKERLLKFILVYHHSIRLHKTAGIHYFPPSDADLNQVPWVYLIHILSVVDKTEQGWVSIREL